MQEFNLANKSVTTCFELFQLFVNVDNIKIVTMLPTLVGMDHYTVLWGLVSPQLSKKKTFDETLKKHYNPEPIAIAEHFHFYQRSQGTSKSIRDYSAGLRHLVNHSKFSAFLEEAIWNRLVCGMQSEGIQNVLLGKTR